MDLKILFFFSITFQFIFSQKVLEFNNTYDINFTVYDENNNKLNKLVKEADFSMKSPEKVAQAYFFAFNNSWLMKLYYNKKNALKRDESHYANLEKTKSENIYMQLLHKTIYKFQGRKMCYIMFIVKIKDLSFPFPTLLSLIKIDNKWMINSRANQQKLTECLMMFKPCVLSNLITGKSSNNYINKLIIKTKSNNNYLDFVKLFPELIQISNNEQLAEKLTLAKDEKCNIEYKKEVKGKVNFTALFEKIDVKNYTLEDQKKNAKFINLIKQ